MRFDAGEACSERLACPIYNGISLQNRNATGYVDEPTKKAEIEGGIEAATLKAIMINGLTLWAVMPSGSAAEFQLIGSGVDSCGQWAADFQDESDPGIDSQHQDLEWVLGFTSGIGCVAAPYENPVNGLDGQAVSAWMIQYCQAHPLAGIFKAVEDLIRQHPQ